MAEDFRPIGSHQNENHFKDRNDGVWSRDNKKEYLMTLDLNHDGVKDYIKRNNLELKKIESKETLVRNLLRTRDLRTGRPLEWPDSDLCPDETGS